MQIKVSFYVMNITVAELVEGFDSGDIRLPVMQRDFVWRPRKVTQLLDSLYQGWPIGAFYVWHAQDDLPFKPRNGALLQRRLNSISGFLLDGQQRLTSISLAIRAESEAGLHERGFFDIQNEEFYLGEMKRTVTKRIDAGDPLIVPLSDIVIIARDGEADLNAVEQIMRSLRDRNEFTIGNNKEVEYRRKLQKLATMLRRPALCDEFSEREEEDAFQLFSRLNKGGTSLSTGEVAAARLASAGTRKIVGPMRAVVAENDMRVMGVNFVFLLRALVTVHRGNCSFSKLPKSWAEDTGEIEASWKSTEQAVRATVRFAREEMGWTTRRWLPSTMALIPIIYLLAKTGGSKLRGKDADAVRRYLLITGLRGFFRGSTETVVNSFVNSIKNTKGDRPILARALFAKIPGNRLYRIKKADILATSGMYSSLMQIYLAYLFAKSANSWPSQRSLREVLHGGLSNDPLGVHHIFPRKMMQERDFPLDRLNTVANYAILSQADNSELGDRDPFDVWRTLSPDQRECASLQLGFVGREDLLREFDEFIEYRAEKLAEQLNEFLSLGERRPPKP
jgi:hypothetical protein